MYRKQQPDFRMNIFFDEGGLGDNISWLPVIKYLLQTHKHVKLNLWYPDYLDGLIKLALNNEPNITFNKFSEAAKCTENLPAKRFKTVPYKNLAIHLTHHGFHVLCSKVPTDQEASYLTANTDSVDLSKFNLPEDYVVMTTGFTADVREFKAEKVNELVLRIKSELGLEVVFLGSKETKTGLSHVIKGEFKTDIDFTQGTSLIDQTTLVEALAIMNKSQAVIGLDNGLLHLAAMTTNIVPIIGGFTSVLPEHRMPYRNGVLGLSYYPITVKSLPCFGCQSNWTFTFFHQFTKCYYVEKKEDTKIQCVEQISVDDFFQATKEATAQKSLPFV
jgi:phosphohistidine swiveling domain-containing protein